MQVERTPEDLSGDGTEEGPGELVEAEDPTIPRSDLALDAAADVARLLSQAFGLRRIVRLAERVAADEPSGDAEVPAQPRVPSDVSLEPVDGTPGGSPPT